MHRFYLAPWECRPPLLALAGAEAHHARDVLRLNRGAEVAVLDGAGREFFCEVRGLDRRQVTLAVTRGAVAPAPPARITLVQAVPKGKFFESIIQKAVELGVTRIIPLLSARVTTKLDAAAAKDKAEKWRQTAVEAIKQCGQPWLPEIREPLGLAALLAEGLAADLGLVGSLQGDGRHPRQYFEQFLAQHRHPPHTVAAWIGPEGDFTPEELDAIREAGAHPVNLGPLVLRSETAAIYTLSVINYELNAPAPAA
jgi:16S rRNA (uracil1498-N3)-methyltransferase